MSHLPLCKLSFLIWMKGERISTLASTQDQQLVPITWQMMVPVCQGEHGLQALPLPIPAPLCHSLR